MYLSSVDNLWVDNSLPLGWSAKGQLISVTYLLTYIHAYLNGLDMLAFAKYLTDTIILEDVLRTGQEKMQRLSVKEC